MHCGSCNFGLALVLMAAILIFSALLLMQSTIESFQVALDKLTTSEQIFPVPFSPHNRVLGLILANDFNRLDPIIIILNEYKSMCESGWKPTISFFTSADVTESVKLLIRDKLWCYHIASYIPVVWNVRSAALGVQLAHETRLFLRHEINNHDIFIYHEEDMIVTHSHVAAYLFETKRLHYLLGEEISQRYMIGFQRYRRSLRQHHESRRAVSENDILHQEHLIEIPFFKPICLGGQCDDLSAHLILYCYILRRAIPTRGGKQSWGSSKPSSSHVHCDQIASSAHG